MQIKREKEVQNYGLYQCILGWRGNLCTGADLNGKNKDASRKDHGDVSVSWRTAWGTWDLPAVY